MKGKITFLSSLLLIFLLLFNTSCGIYKPVDARKVPQNAKEKRRQNINEGKGISLKNVIGNNSTNFEFSTANPLWRASLDVLDFIPLQTVDYAGGLIITDWYNDRNSNDSLKLSIRFLTNVVRADSLKITVFKKNCKSELNCNSQIYNSRINAELASAIIKKAALLEKEAQTKKK